MAKILFLLIGLLSSISLWSQQPDTEEPIYEIVHKKPQFPGGEMAMQEFIASNLTYPNHAKHSGLEGNVVIQFVVEKDSTLSNFNVVRSPDKELSKEALRIMALMPKWSTGSQNNKAVRTRMSIVIKFSLKEVDGDYSVYQQADIPAQYSGGPKAMQKFIQSHFNLPEDDFKKHKNEEIIVAAIVEKDGKLTNVRIHKSICPSCDEEAVKAISEMPDWTPAKLKSEVVRSVVFIPIYIKKL